jgi:translation elongation factor EF-Ts
MSEAERAMDLHRRTGMGVLECREAIRQSADERDQIEFLRRIVTAEVVERYGSATAVTWRYPPGLRDD